MSREPSTLSSDMFPANAPWRTLISRDDLLGSFAPEFHRRRQRFEELRNHLTDNGRRSLAEVASGHDYFGLHFKDGEWVFREWAPNADRIFLIGQMTGWAETPEYELKRISNHGAWEIRLPKKALRHELLYRLRVHWPGGSGDRIPAWSRLAAQDSCSLIFNARVWYPPKPYEWRHDPPGLSGGCHDDAGIRIYEAHVGMATSEPRVGGWAEFTRNVLPRIARAGYNTVELMAVQEHPYYGSFGYQVSGFFAASSRFGTPCELKELVDTAHGLGLTVIMDLVHSHSVSNEVEGLSRFDGTAYQFFHDGPRGRHMAWDSRCFDYGKTEVLHFLLSNCRFWLEEYRFDGFRFDGITSMLYLDHGLEKAFTRYEDYFDENTDIDALAYLTLANELIHEIRPNAVTIAEDMSGMPGLAAPLSMGGTGFDYRFAMGIPDLWIRLTKDMRDDDWPLGHLFHELTNRRSEEKTISYAESHDQALVGDKTLIFRMADAAMYGHMGVDDDHPAVDRAMALHKMIRLITLATAGGGYLNFMGNEFGHPEWIDFPREGNGWSHHYARRQWHLAEDPGLKYRFLNRFDRDLMALAERHRLPASWPPQLIHEHEEQKILAFERNHLVFAFNFHPTNSYTDYEIRLPFFRPRTKEDPGGGGAKTDPPSYRMILDTDSAIYGGHGRLAAGQVHPVIGPEPADTLQMEETSAAAGEEETATALRLYLPCRTAMVLSPAA